ncbi:MAG: hypothetical protein MJD61_20650 [Proteobacteria bacterium]|nr:hypothetical protein [Pseudomonadota bacterium]
MLGFAGFGVGGGLGLAGYPASPGGSPHDCGGKMCADPGIEGLGACCLADETCGVRGERGACVEASGVEPRCAHTGPGPGCCKSNGTCGFLPGDGRCVTLTQGPYPGYPVYPGYPGFPGFGGAPGSSTPVVEQRCDGAHYCEANQCAPPAGSAAPCCLPGGSCGVRLGASLGGYPGPEFSPTGCMQPGLVHAACPGGCCTAEGYCGRPSSSGTKCLLDVGSAYTTDCTGNLRPFACAGVLCPEARGSTTRPRPYPNAGRRPRCCTSGGECGLILNGHCVASAILDPDCPDQAQAVGCCAADNLCGVWDGANNMCLAPSASQSLVRDCDGNAMVRCAMATCTVSSGAMLPFAPCCTASGECGVQLPNRVCVDGKLISPQCPGGRTSPVGCCTPQGICGGFDATGACVAGLGGFAGFGGGATLPCNPAP